MALSILILALSRLAFCADVEITVREIRAPQGTVRVALYPESESSGFPDDAKPLAIATAAVKGKEPVSITVPGIAPGKYAIALYQDENDDSVMGKDVIGVPSEPFGFSQNPRIFFGAPGFGRSSFIVGQEKVTLEVKLKTF